MTSHPLDTLTARVCALPGCDNPIGPDPNTPERRYCGIAHRKVARKLRRSTNATDRTSTRLAEPTATPAPVAQPAPVAAAFLAAASTATAARSDLATGSTGTATGSGLATSSGTATSSGLATGSGADPANAAVAVPARPPRMLAGAGTRGPNGEPGLTRHGYRRLVTEPRNRWYQRSGRSFAARGVRPETGRWRRTRPVRGEPEPWWLSDAAPAAPALPVPTRPAPAPPVQPPTEAGPTPVTAPPSPPAAPTAPAAARQSTSSPAPTPPPADPPTAPTPAAKPARPVTAPAPAAPPAPLGRGAVRARRRAEKELARREAAAVLSGALLPGEAPPARRGRKRGAARPLPAPIVPAADASQALWGQLREALLAALHSLGNNRLRSLLTTIGIVAGVAAVIVMVAMGDGMRQQYQVQTDRFANQINISKAKMGAGVGTSRNLTDADVKALSDRKKAPAIGEISEAMANDVPVTAGQQRARAQLIGAQFNYARLTDRKLAAGTWFTQRQMASGDRSVILGPQTVNLLHGSDVDPHTLIGQTVRLSHSNFKVQGVLKSNGQADNSVIVPFVAARTHLTGNQNGKVDTIILKSTDLTNVDDAAGQAYDILDRQHGIRDASTRDYNITTFTQELKKSLDFINYLTWFIVGIAAISLFVGGVGVANIMLVSVTERTREIGIRKAVGATTTAILRQFLSEAVILTGLGGLAGVGLGLACTEAGILLLPALGAGDPDSDIPIPIMSAAPVLIAFLVSLIIGLLAGGYPAHRAARLRPIQALRFE